MVGVLTPYVLIACVCVCVNSRRIWCRRRVPRIWRMWPRTAFALPTLPSPLAPSCTRYAHRRARTCTLQQCWVFGSRVGRLCFVYAVCLSLCVGMNLIVDMCVVRFWRWRRWPPSKRCPFARLFWRRRCRLPSPRRLPPRVVVRPLTHSLTHTRTYTLSRLRHGAKQDRSVCL